MTRRTLSEYRYELDNLGLFTRLLTNKAKKLNTKINDAEGDLRQIETTLQSIRQRHDQRLVRFEKLNAIICEEEQKVEETEHNLPLLTTNSRDNILLWIQQKETCFLFRTIYSLCQRQLTQTASD